MAGDWIKLEHATLDKPEVHRIAELLGVSVDQSLGILLRFWVWLDRNSRHGSVTHMSRKSLDNVTHTAGFGACLIDVGWAEHDAETGILTIINFDRHNGNSAKTRALDRDRAVTLRSRKRHAESVTREEKRRVTKELQATAPSEPNDEHRALATELRVDCDVEFAKYTDHFAATGKPHKDAVAGFRNWLRRAAEYRKPSTGPPRSAAPGTARQQTANAIFGEQTDEQQPTDITGQSRRIA